MSDKIRLIADTLFTLLLDTGVTPQDGIRNHTQAFNTVCTELSWGQSWTDNTRMSKFVDAANLYWMFMLVNNDKIVVTGKDVEKMNGVIRGIEAAGLRTPLLDNRVTEGEGIETYREKALTFTMSGGFPCKILVDNLEIDHNRRVATITDLKTTSWPIENFVNGYRYAPDEFGTVQKVSSQGDYMKYMYYFQEFFYKIGVTEWIIAQGYESYDVQFQFGVVETSEPYLCEMIKPNSQWMAIAGAEFHGAMANVKQWFTDHKYLEF
jgi:hypothetical protein